jgi:hypothetical protein
MHVGSKRKAVELGEGRAKRMKILRDHQRQAMALESQIRMCSQQLAHAHAQYIQSETLSKQRLHMVVGAKKESNILRNQIHALIQRINLLETLVKKMKQENMVLQRKYSMCSEHIRTLTGHSPTQVGGRLVL